MSEVHKLASCALQARHLADKLIAAKELLQTAAEWHYYNAAHIERLECRVADLRAHPERDDIRVTHEAAGSPHPGFLTGDGLTRVPDEVVAALGAGDLVWLPMSDKPGFYVVAKASVLMEIDDV